MDDPYEILGVEPGASRDEILAAYRTLSAALSPAALEGAPLAQRVAAERRAKDVATAYRILTAEVPDTPAPPPPASSAYAADPAGPVAWGDNARARYDAAAAQVHAYQRGRGEGWRTVGLLIACGSALFVPLFVVARLLT